MALTYGFLKCKIVSDPALKANRHKNEMQYHLHSTLEVAEDDGSTRQWDSAINVGTNDSDDLLKYKFIFDFHHPIITTLKAGAAAWLSRKATLVKQRKCEAFCIEVMVMATSRGSYSSRLGLRWPHWPLLPCKTCSTWVARRG
jgi:hypothetical protein